MSLIGKEDGSSEGNFPLRFAEYILSYRSLPVQYFSKT